MSFVSQKLLLGKRRKQFLQSGSNFDDYVVNSANKINSSGDVFVTFNNTAGAARVYAWNGTAWIQRGSDITSSNSDCVSIDSSGLVVSLTGNTTSVYAWNGTSWVQRGANIGVVGMASSLSSNGNFIVIGNRFFSGNNGVVYVYGWNGVSWTQRGSTFIDSEGKLLGASVSINSSGDVIAIGAPFFFSQGQVYVYSWNGSSWIESFQVDGASGDQIGGSGKVSINSSGNTLAIGFDRRAYSGINNVGFVSVSKQSGASWSNIGFINNSGEQARATNSFYGKIVSLNSSGDILAIGSSVGVQYKIDIFKYLTGNSWNKIGYITLPDDPRSLSLNSSGNVLAVGTLNYSRIYRYT